MGCGRKKMLKGHLTMLLTIPSKTINFFQCPAPPFKELNFSLTTDPQPLTSFNHDPEWRISVTVWRPQFRPGLPGFGARASYVVCTFKTAVLNYYCLLPWESWTPQNYFLKLCAWLQRTRCPGTGSATWSTSSAASRRTSRRGCGTWRPSSAGRRSCSHTSRSTGNASTTIRASNGISRKFS